MRRSFAITMLAVALPASASSPPTSCTLPTLPVTRDTALLDRDLKLTPDPGNSLKLRLLLRYDGPCADQIVDTQFGRIKLADGRRFVRDKDGFTPNNDIVTIEGSPSPIPQLRGMKFEGKAIVQIGKAYLGLWRGKGRSVVARYDATGRAPVVLIDTPLTIRGVQYFPCVDTPCGSITLIVRQGGDTYEAGLAWDHPGYVEWGKK